jgi:hypothetical protein
MAESVNVHSASAPCADRHGRDVARCEYCLHHVYISEMTECECFAHIVHGDGRYYVCEDCLSYDLAPTEFDQISVDPRCKMCGVISCPRCVVYCLACAYASVGQDDDHVAVETYCQECRSAGGLNNVWCTEHTSYECGLKDQDHIGECIACEHEDEDEGDEGDDEGDD